MKAVILGPSSRGSLEFLWRQVGQSGQSGQPPYTGCGDIIFWHLEDVLGHFFRSTS